MLPYVILPVQPALKEWIESIFIMNVDFVGSSLPSVFTYPWSVTTHIYFTIGGDPVLVKSASRTEFVDYAPNFIIGPRLSTDIVDLGRQRYVAAISFRPGGLFRLLGIPLNELTEGLDLSLVMSRHDRELSERLINTSDYQDVFQILENFLLKKVRTIKPLTSFDLAIHELIEQNGNTPIKQVASQAGLSMRQFERRSLTHLGVSPKLFSRITRFANACIFKEANPQKTWLQVTYEYGYADQMHLIDDFKVFSGATPTELEAQLSMKVLTGIECRTM